MMQIKIIEIGKFCSMTLRQFNEFQEDQEDFDRAVRGVCDIRPEWRPKCMARTNFFW